MWNRKKGLMINWICACRSVVRYMYMSIWTVVIAVKLVKQLFLKEVSGLLLAQSYVAAILVFSGIYTLTKRLQVSFKDKVLIMLTFSQYYKCIVGKKVLQNILRQCNFISRIEDCCDKNPTAEKYNVKLFKQTTTNFNYYQIMVSFMYFLKEIWKKPGKCL